MSQFVLLGIFFIGMLVQAFYMLIGKFESKDIKKILFPFVFSILGLYPTDREIHGVDDYDLPLHFFFVCLAAAFGFAHQFRRKLLPRILGQMLLIWNILFIFVVYNHFGLWLPILFIISIPTLLTVFNAFKNIDTTFGWQVFFHSWFSIMIVSIGVLGFTNGVLDIFTGGAGMYTLSPFTIFISGAAFLFLSVNIWYVVALIPIPPRKPATMHDRFIEIFRLMRLVSSGYIWGKNNVAVNLLIITAIPAIIYINLITGYISEMTLVPLVLVIISVIDGYRKSELLPKEKKEAQLDNLTQDDIDTINKLDRTTKRLNPPVSTDKALLIVFILVVLVAIAVMSLLK